MAITYKIIDYGFGDVNLMRMFLGIRRKVFYGSVHEESITAAAKAR